MTPDNGVRRLAVAVLRLAVEDAGGGDTRQARQARAWLAGDTARLRFWLDCAGLSRATWQAQRRAHLDESQRAMVAARLANMRQGTRTDIPPIGGFAEVSQSDSAQLLNVGERSVQRARVVQQHGTPEHHPTGSSGKIGVIPFAVV